MSNARRFRGLVKMSVTGAVALCLVPACCTWRVARQTVWQRRMTMPRVCCRKRPFVLAPRKTFIRAFVLAAANGMDVPLDRSLVADVLDKQATDALGLPGICRGGV